jgi:hypothetical protein
MLVDREGRQHHASLPFGGTPDSAIRHLRDLAGREVHPMLVALVAATPQPLLQTIVDVVPTRTVFGRVCLLGDAAFVVRPHTAGATAKAARDATTLARALKRAGRNVDAGLSDADRGSAGSWSITAWRWGGDGPPERGCFDVGEERSKFGHRMDVGLRISPQ